MKCIVPALMVTFVFLLILIAGCTQTPQMPVATPVATTPAATTSQTIPIPQETTARATVPITGPGTPGPTQVLPPDYRLDFQIQGNGNTATPEISVTLSGGNGINLDPQFEATLYRSDGIVKKQVMKQPFKMSEPMIFPSTSSNYNRIVINVTAPTLGVVTVRDEYVPFKNINP
jgi:hypothetical protein